MRRFEIKEQDEHVLIADTEYGIDIDILVFGAFKSKAHQTEYAEALVQTLNAAAIPTLEFSKYDETGSLRSSASRADTAVGVYAG